MARGNWALEVDGVNHLIEYSGRNLFVGGQKVRVTSKNPFVMLIDYPIQLGNKIVNLVVIGNQVDLAVDGYMLGSKEPYVPIDRAPGWTWAFIAIQCIGGWFLSGLLGFAIGVLLSLFYVRISLSRNKSTSVKILLSLVVLILSLVILGVVSFFIGMELAFSGLV